MKNVTYFNDIPGVSELLDEKKINVLKGPFFEDFQKTLKKTRFHVHMKQL